MTNGDPDIINDPEFQPKKKENWNDIFADPKKKKSPAAISHHRTSDHEVRILQQKTTPVSSGSSGSSYKCGACNFSTNRMNVFILHNKSHTKEELTSPKKAATVTPKAKATPKTLNQTLRDVKQTPIIDMSDDEDEIFESPKVRKKKPRKTPAKSAKATKKAAAVVDEPKPNAEIKSSLLADWSDDEVAVEQKPIVAPSLEEPVVVPPVKAESPIKCRNIPKKRNDFTFDDLKVDEIVQKKEDQPPKIESEIEEEDLEKLLDEVGGEGKLLFHYVFPLS